MIKIEDFKKLEIRIGTIVEATRIEGADRLLKLIIDLDNEQRQLVAGLGHLHTPEELIHKQVPIIVNLEPAKFRGVESNGMLVAIDDEGATLLIPEKTVPNGTKLR